MLIFNFICKNSFFKKKLQKNYFQKVCQNCKYEDIMNTSNNMCKDNTFYKNNKSEKTRL